MLLSIKRVKAIFIKDWKEAIKSPNLYVCLFIPILGALIWRQLDTGQSALYFYTFSIALASIVPGIFNQSAIIAEEKEKNTLRGLLLSPIRIIEIFIGKSLLTAIMIILASIGATIIVPYEVTSYVYFSLAILLSMTIFISIGTIMGLIVTSVQQSLGLSVLFTTLFGNSLALKLLITQDWFVKGLEFLPHEQFALLLVKMTEGANFSDLTNYFAVLLAWLVVTVGLSVIIYRNTGFDK